MKKFYIGAAFIFVALLICSVLCSCNKEREMTIYGTVFSAGEPLAGVEIFVGNADAVFGQTITGTDGTYNVHFTYDGEINNGFVRARKSGYRGDEIYFDVVNGKKIQIDITLR